MVINTEIRRLEDQYPLSASRAFTWQRCIDAIRYAFQPIVDIHSGVCCGYEALMRDWRFDGVSGISALLERAWRDNMHRELDLALRCKASAAFAQLRNCARFKLFYNIDVRMIEYLNSHAGECARLLETLGPSPHDICFEIAFNSAGPHCGSPHEISCLLKKHGCKIVVDDCGTSSLDFQTLFHLEPDFIKLDRFFIEGIARNRRKQVFAASIVNIAAQMGSSVIAEGVETEEELRLCKDIGCNLAQGFLISPAETDLSKLREKYEIVQQIHHRNRRAPSSDCDLVLSLMDYIEPLPNDMEISSVFARFKESNQWRLFPIVNRHHEPLGVIREFDLKDFAYSRYGHELLQNPGIKKQTGLFIEPFPCVDIHTPAEKILELFAGRKNSEGIILVHNRRYAGFLGAAALLTVLNEKNLAAARDQNPLTRLPGNNRIGEYVSRALDDVDSGYYLVYFDFDNFKPYNDTYGFRRGDRVILLFAEMLRSNEIRREMFVGHIGGDDFFMGFHGTQFQVVDRITRRLIDDFKFHVEGFYDKEARGCGYIAAKDREGNLRQYGLLTVSAVILELSPGRRRMTPELAGEYLANLKKQAKQNPSGLVRSSVNDYAAQTSLFDTAG